MFLFLTIGKRLADIVGQFDHIGCVFPRLVWFCFELCNIEKLALSRTAGELTEQGHEVKEARWTPETMLERILHHCHKTGQFAFVSRDRPVWVLVLIPYNMRYIICAYNMCTTV